MPLYGLIGFPLTHSFSRKFFTEKFSKAGLKNFDYRNFEIPSIDDLLNLLQQHKDLYGLNVTIPYKIQSLEYLDEVDDLVSAVGAVNVIAIESAGTKRILKGYNTDVIGFEKSLMPLLKPNMNKALILGTGGAARSVKYVLNKLGIEYQVVSRTKALHQTTYEKLNQEKIEDHLLIINATPLGTFPHVSDAPNIPYDFLTPNHLLYDLVYNPDESLFLKKGKKQKTKTKNGMEMLTIQAEKAFDIFLQQWKGK